MGTRTVHAPDIGRSFRERSLSALCKAGSGFPVDPCVSEATPLLRAPTQMLWQRSACAMANFHRDGRCLPPPPQTLMDATRRCARDRPPKANARSSPDQMACFSSPAPGWLLGSRTVVLLALPVVYNDETMGKIACVALCCPAKTGPPLWWLPPIGGSQWTNAPAVLASKCLWRRQDRKKWR